jgi:transaldolase
LLIPSSELRNSTEPVPKKLEAESANQAPIEKVSYVDDQEKFMAELKKDQMANDKVSRLLCPRRAFTDSSLQLTEGIQGFEKDGAALKQMLKEKLQ